MMISVFGTKRTAPNKDVSSYYCVRNCIRFSILGLREQSLIEGPENKSYIKLGLLGSKTIFRKKEMPVR